MELHATNRQCGECTACCVYLSIEEPQLSKPGLTHCKNLVLPGPEKEGEVYYTGGNDCENCTVHGTEQRPEVCEGFKCGWLMGFGDEQDRPDRSFILADFIAPSGRIENAINIKPLVKDQQDTEEGRATIRRISKDAGMPAIVLRFQETGIVRIEGRAAE